MYVSASRCQRDVTAVSCFSLSLSLSLPLSLSLYICMYTNTHTHIHTHACTCTCIYMHSHHGGKQAHAPAKEKTTSAAIEDGLRRWRDKAAVRLPPVPVYSVYMYRYR